MADSTEIQKSDGSLTGGKATTDGAAVTTMGPPALNEAPVVSDTGKTYIASTTEWAWANIDRALSQTVDEAEAKYGTKLYEHDMMKEPTMASIDRALKILVMADGLRPAVSHPDPPRTNATSQQKEDSDKAKVMLGYMLECVARLDETCDDSLDDVARNLLDGCRIGQKLAEVTYNDIGFGEYKGRYGLETLACKPRENFAFVVTPMNKFLGVMARIPGQMPLIWRGPISSPAIYANMVAPEKILNFVPERVDGDPRGKSWWRACWDPYERKRLAKPHEVRTLVQYGGGMIVVTAPDHNASVTVTNVEDPTGPKIPLMQAVDIAAAKLRAGHHATFPFQTLITVDRPSGDLSMFESSMTRYDEEMIRGFVLTAQLFKEARHSSKASSDTAADLIDELKMYVRGKLCGLLNRMSRRLVFMSYGPDWVKYAPVFKMQKASRPDFAANATALGPLLTAIGTQTTEEQWDYFMVEVLGAPAGRVKIDVTPTDPEADPTEDEGDPAAMAGRFPGALRPSRASARLAERHRRGYAESL